jgi:hypothetical protein
LHTRSPTPVWPARPGAYAAAGSRATVWSSSHSYTSGDHSKTGVTRRHCSARRRFTREPWIATVDRSAPRLVDRPSWGGPEPGEREVTRQGSYAEGSTWGVTAVGPEITRTTSSAAVTTPSPPRARWLRRVPTRGCQGEPRSAPPRASPPPRAAESAGGIPRRCVPQPPPVTPGGTTLRYPRPSSWPRPTAGRRR